MKQHRRSFASRLFEYQGERFPIAQHGPLIVVFTFSAVSYSRVCRGADGFIPIGEFALGAATSIFFFFLLRIFDEFKDAEEDARFRPYRPVPRGLVTLPELRNLSVILALLIFGANALVTPRLLPAIACILLYMGLMTKEFFVRDWLKKHPLIYMTSHMLVMPMIDFYTTGLDWILSAPATGASPPSGLEFFLLVTFLNGIVIEVGRKIRAEEDEEDGVETYSALYGMRRAAWSWALLLAITWGSAILAADYAGYGLPGFAALTAILILCAVPAMLFVRSGSPRHAKLIETAAGIWTIGMYLTLGGIPMVARWIGG